VETGRSPVSSYPGLRWPETPHHGVLTELDRAGGSCYFWSLTQGIVSQIRPSYTWRYDDGIRRVATTIQTQAPINPGNSGGPLLNDEGSVLGIVSAGVTEAQGIFFAIAGGHIRELIRS